MKSPILLAALLVAAPAIAQTKVDERVGPWRVTGEAGDCLAFFGSPDGMVMVASPAAGGENHGGVMFAKPGFADDPARTTTMELGGAESFSLSFEVRPMDDTNPTIYWRSFASDTTIDAWPDAWLVRMKRGTDTMAQVTVTGFGAARSALRRCVAKTR